MDTKFWVRVTAKQSVDDIWYMSKVAASKKKPHTESNELAFCINADIPDSLFEQPIFEISITLPHIPIRAKGVTAKVADDVEKFLKDKTGLNVYVTMADPEEGEDE